MGAPRSRPNKTPTPNIRSYNSLRGADASHLSKALTEQVQEDDVSGSTEAILLCLQDATAFKVLVFDLNAEVDMRIHHVLQLIGARHLTVFGHLSDDYNIACMLFSIRCE